MVRRIVTAKPPKRSARKPPRSQAAAIPPERVVVTAKQQKGRFVRKPAELPDDAEADERVAAFFRRMIVPRS